MASKEDPLKRIEALIVMHQSKPSRFDGLMHLIADKLERRVGTYAMVSFNSNDYDEDLLRRASSALSKFDQLLVTFQGSSNDPRGSRAILTIRFKD